jgi:hypothetical protein
MLRRPTLQFSLIVWRFAISTGPVLRSPTLFNTENFGLPNRTVQSAQFGRITSTQTEASARTVQFSLRYSF